MNKEEKENVDLLSEIVVYNKYAKYIPELQRRESWIEIVQRYLDMLNGKFPALSKEIYENGQYILNKKVLPSMRAMQFAGKAIEKNEARIYNCAYLPIDDTDAFSEIMFLLLGGTGVGYSVQFKHVDKLPEIKKPTKSQKYLVQDSIIGWADAIKHLMRSYFGNRNTKPNFDFSDIRPQGARLKTAGGKAPGPDPLRRCLFEIERILESKNNGDKLTTLEVHDIVCHLADSVLAGGIRRAALISLFSADDELMLGCKFGNWWELNPQRGRANNSAVLLRHKLTKTFFMDLWKKIELSGSGEPGFYLTNNSDWGTNPCCFTGDMRLLTPSGYRTFKDLAAEVEFEAINKDGEIVPSKVWSNGFKETNVIRLSNGVHITCTPDHRFMTIDGKEVQAKDSKGLRLMPYYIINEEVSEFVKYGFIQGDGCTGRLDSLTHKGLEIYFGEKDEDVAELFESKIGKQYINGFNDKLKELEFSAESLPTRSLPKKYFNFSKSAKLQFLKGIYTANGSVIKAGRVALKSTCRKLVEEISADIYRLSDFKVKPYITTNKAKEVKFSNGNYTCKESYDLNIANTEGIKWFSENIGFVQTYKKEDLKNLIINKAPMVTSIANTREKEVFDFSLDDTTHWGIVEGVVAHNCEIALRPFQMCNLCEVNVSNIESQEDLDKRVLIASFFGTLQASYTDFHYLRPIWKKTCEKDALIGIGMTGIASMEVFKYNLQQSVLVAKLANKGVAHKININPAARITCVKPSGTTSCVLGTSSGIHAWHDEYYIRRMQVSKNEDIYKYLAKEHSYLVKDHLLIPNSAVIEIPIKAPKGSVLRTESALDLLERVKKVSQEWIKPGHLSGDNSHNVSATISINKDNLFEEDITHSFPDIKGGHVGKDGAYYFNEWEVVGEWMWKNKQFYNGLSVLPFDGGTYSQAPFESIIEEEYNKLSKQVKPINLTDIIEEEDNTDLKGELACAGTNCEIK